MEWIVNNKMQNHSIFIIYVITAKGESREASVCIPLDVRGWWIMFDCIVVIIVEGEP